MKTLRIMITISATILVTLGNVFTQEVTAEKKTQVGVAVAITDIKEVFQYIDEAISAPEIFITINVSPKLRLEPGIAFFQSSSGNGDFKSSSKSFSIGLGIFPMTLKDGINLYYGARLGLIRTSSEYSFNGSDSEEMSAGGFFIAPTVGGEYFLNSSFTLGGEAQLRYASFTKEDGIDEEGTSSTTSTRALLFLRFYF
ncbi:MAG: outer membrane beta-barrel protein [Candidatus Marinimicrobia bacterium]|nr:outer membrane beta-barrel protein [Candidatus Neomarinimicrobiota bacterium]